MHGEAAGAIAAKAGPGTSDKRKHLGCGEKHDTACEGHSSPVAVPVAENRLAAT